MPMLEVVDTVSKGIFLEFFAILLISSSIPVDAQIESKNKSKEECSEEIQCNIGLELS